MVGMHPVHGETVRRRDSPNPKTPQPAIGEPNRMIAIPSGAGFTTVKGDVGSVPAKKPHPKPFGALRLRDCGPWKKVPSNRGSLRALQRSVEPYGEPVSIDYPVTVKNTGEILQKSQLIRVLRLQTLLESGFLNFREKITGN